MAHGYTWPTHVQGDQLSRIRQKTPDLSRLSRALGHDFRDESLLKQALTHSSTVGPLAAGETSAARSNERLEFLGDRVLGLVVAAMLYERFPQEEEGGLAKRFAALVSGDTLAMVAKKIDVKHYIDVSQQGLINTNLLSDTLEAVIAALYLDGGMAAAERFIKAQWDPLLGDLTEAPRDAKTALQEWAQGRGLALPVYRNLSREGPPHQPVFKVEVSVEELGKSVGTGRSKREAQRNAAETLLTRALKNDDRQ